MRVFAVSDIHIDFAENRRWLTQLSDQDYQEDLLILAGDISDLPAHLEACFQQVTAKFAKVMFVPGNHDLWNRRCESASSVAKYLWLEQLAQGFGIETNMLFEGGLVVIGLKGWYDYSFGQPSAQLRDVWADYHACSWPEDFDEAKITHYFTSKNLQSAPVDGKMLITFSHFLPRIDLMPAYIPPKHRIIYPVLGSQIIDKQLRALGSRLHIYGHSHLNRAKTIDGVKYINNAYGYPSEKRITYKRLLCVYED